MTNKIASKQKHERKGGKPKDIVIPVMGLSGVGKSTFINALMNAECMTVGVKLVSCTQKVNPAIIDTIPGYPHLKGYRLIVLDTPGFDDTNCGDIIILKRIADWLNSYQKKGVLGGVIYLHEISSDRFSDAARRNLAVFKRMCGGAALTRVVLGTTKWSRTPLDIAQRHETLLKGEYWKELIENGSEVLQFVDDLDSAWKFINIILERLNTENDSDMLLQTDKGLEYLETTEKQKKAVKLPLFSRLFERFSFWAKRM